MLIDRLMKRLVGLGDFDMLQNDRDPARFHFHHDSLAVNYLDHSADKFTLGKHGLRKNYYNKRKKNRFEVFHNFFWITHPLPQVVLTYLVSKSYSLSRR